MQEFATDDPTLDIPDTFSSGLQHATRTHRKAELTEQFRLLKAVFERPVTFERRRQDRIGLPILLRVTPLDQTGRRLDELAMTVVGKDISPRGISFFHERPLPYRRATIEFDHPDVGRFSMEVDVSWCQFLRQGWYISGGRLLNAAARQPEADISS